MNIALKLPFLHHIDFLFLFTSLDSFCSLISSLTHWLVWLVAYYLAYRCLLVLSFFLVVGSSLIPLWS